MKYDITQTNVYIYTETRAHKKHTCKYTTESTAWDMIIIHTYMQTHIVRAAYVGLVTLHTYMQTNKRARTHIRTCTQACAYTTNSHAHAQTNTCTPTQARTTSKMKMQFFQEANTTKQHLIHQLLCLSHETVTTTRFSPFIIYVACYTCFENARYEQREIRIGKQTKVGRWQMSTNQLRRITSNCHICK